jgi:acyl-[acyl-carrier-protein]-phospholipid O-acyltransferase/long-chain-fatty-acid--[acyl-carrier-protein] ligase
MTTLPPSDDDAAATGAFEPTRRQWTGYWAMIVQQTQNAFNDKAAQFILIPLAAAVGFALPGNFGVETAAGAIIALPFVLFAPLAGWFSDRFSKRDVMLAMALAQVAILGWISIGVWQGNLGMALTGFFALAMQSAFFSPAKIGINKELVGSRHLGFAAGVQQMMAMVAILIGQVVAGWWFDTRYIALGATPDAAKQAALWPLCVLTALSVPGVLMAWVVPRVRAQGLEPFRVTHAFRHFRDLGELWREAGLRRGAFGVAFFWGFAAYLNLWSVKVAKEITGGEAGFGTLSSKYMAAASIGMVLGFGFASWLLRRRIELGWVPLAGAAMTIGSVALAFMHPTGWWFLAGLGGLAFSGAVFLAPLNAWMQDNYPANKRGELQAAVNLQDCFAGILSLVVVEGLLRLAEVCGLSTLAGLRGQLLVVALGCAGITLMVVRLLPRDFIRLLILGLLRTFYRIRAVHPERVPATGGVLLLPNHVTYADAFFLSAACLRPIRFVMDETFMAKGWIRFSARLFGTVPIRRDQPLDAIRVVIDALRNGEVVCLFPEGQLTRSGALCELRRGFELIARKAGHPLLPVWCDGAWGSVFSFERGRFFRKIPYRIPYGLVVAFGRPIDPHGLDTAVVRDAILRASTEAVGRRFSRPGWGLRLPVATAPEEAVRRMKNGGRFACRRIWINGHQIGQINALQRREAIHILAGDPVPGTLPSLVLAFPELHGGRVVVHDSLPASPSGAWVGGDVLRAAFAKLPAAEGIRFFDFGSDPIPPAGCDGLIHLPCLARDGVVIAMSMPHLPPPQPESEFQHGHKPGALGILLPGWQCRAAASGVLRAHGPAAPRGGIALTGVARIDEGGFVFPAP